MQVISQMPISRGRDHPFVRKLAYVQPRYFCRPPHSSCIPSSGFILICECRTLVISSCILPAGSNLTILVTYSSSQEHLQSTGALCILSIFSCPRSLLHYSSSSSISGLWSSHALSLFLLYYSGTFEVDRVSLKIRSAIQTSLSLVHQ